MHAACGREPDKTNAMYTNIILYPFQRSMPSSAPMRTTAAAVLISIQVVEGTGSVFDLSRAGDWRRLLEPRVSFHFNVEETNNNQQRRPDLRSASEHLANIRQVLNLAITDLATAFGVSRQAIYKWIGGEATPEPDKLKRICALSHAADDFREAGIARASSVVKMKAFDGRSLLDLVAADQLLPSHIQALINEARAMDTAYERSGLAKSKARPSDDWRTEVSIPGSPER